jgi:hypothetical protein
MLTQDGKLTDIGSWYLGRGSTGNVPKGDSASTGRFRGWAVVVAIAVGLGALGMV